MGQTSRKLEIRVKKHLNTTKQTSLITFHGQGCSAVIPERKFSVMEWTDCDFDRLIYEDFSVDKLKPNFNKN